MRLAALLLSCASLCALAPAHDSPRPAPEPPCACCAACECEGPCPCLRTARPCGPGCRCVLVADAAAPDSPCGCCAPKREPVGAKVGGPELPDGSRVQCELPPEWMIRNRGGSDGAGLCVFASMAHSGRWQNDPAFAAIFEWMFRFPGGGYPSKVDAMLKKMCAEKGLAPPVYIQVESNDLDVLRAACKTGRAPGVTYGISPTGRYGGRRIAHMVSLVHADADTFVILDNNYPGADRYEILNAREFARSYAYGSKQGWAVILLAPPPPPAPWN